MSRHLSDMGLLRGKDLHSHGEGSALCGTEGPSAHHMAGHDLTSVVMYQDYDSILPRLPAIWMMNGPLHVQWTKRRNGRTIGSDRIKMEVTVAGRADRCTFKDLRRAVGAGSGFPRRREPICSHHSGSPSPLVSNGFGSRSSHPNSTFPRMRDPAATVKEPAVRSPMRVPDCMSCTWEEA